jgi:hypothetical protein
MELRRELMYIKETENGAIFPYSLENIRLENPNTSFPADLELIMEILNRIPKLIVIWN